MWSPRLRYLSCSFITHRIHGAAIYIFISIYGVPWIPSIYPLYVGIYTSTMDPSWITPISFTVIHGTYNKGKYSWAFLKATYTSPGARPTARHLLGVQKRGGQWLDDEATDLWWFHHNSSNCYLLLFKLRIFEVLFTVLIHINSRYIELQWYPTVNASRYTNSPSDGHFSGGFRSHGKKLRWSNSCRTACRSTADHEICGPTNSDKWKYNSY